VITPGVRHLTALQDFQTDTIVIDGRKLLANFTPRESELIRLGMIFNLSIRDMADELVLSRGWVSELVSTIYGKLGVHDILAGESPLDIPFENETVLKHLKDIGDRPTKNLADGRMRKAPWMATLAFHLLTIPEVDEL
jgi:DNA-binding NarL/FixJ family response regulator